MRIPDLRTALRRELWITVGPAFAIAVAAFAVAYYFVKPAPPKTLTIAVGQDEGGYRFFFKKYAALLARDGITLTAHPAAGAESIELLSKDEPGVDAAFLLSGTKPPEQAEGLVSLGALGYQPLWVFYRGEPIEDLGGLRGKRLAIGAAGSETHALAIQLLAANGVDESSTTFLPSARKAAADQLKASEIDAAFFFSPAESPLLKQLAAVPGVRLLSFARADAYVRRFPFLTKLTLPRGVFDLAKDVPAEDVTLLSPTANLVASESLHPALAYLLMKAATEIHGGAGLLDSAGEFPSARESGFALSREAQRFYRSGPPLLQRFLPFWAANLADRMWVLLVPVIAILLPLLRILPPLYRWRVRSRIYRWYAHLKEIELELDDAPETAKLQSALARLDELDRAINRIPTPLSYSENLYSFRQHIDVVRKRIEAGIRAADGGKVSRSA